jgi:hypothetical protein
MPYEAQCGKCGTTATGKLLMTAMQWHIPPAPHAVDLQQPFIKQDPGAALTERLCFWLFMYIQGAAAWYTTGQLTLMNQSVSHV